MVPGCAVCVAAGYIQNRIEAEGCRLADFDNPGTILGRLEAAGLSVHDVASAGIQGPPIDSAVFWRAVYGPAYPEAVMS